MRRVLVVTYFFPPIGGAGGQRPLRLSQHMREYGYEPVVLTGRGDAAERWSPEDPELEREVPADLEVHRVRTAEPRTSRSRSRLERLAGVPQPWSRWWSSAIAELGEPLAKSCDLVWTIMQPYGSARPVAEVAHRTGIPWVADLADPWALDEILVYPSTVHRRLATRAMRRGLETASGVVMSTPEAAHRIRTEFPEFASRPIAVGPHGWDRSDFARTASRRSDDAFRIVHTGYLHTELGRRHRQAAPWRKRLGGGRDGADLYTRSHVFLLEALDRILTARPQLRGLIEVHLAGVQTDSDREVAAAHSDVRMLGYLSHTESVALMRSADLLFLPMHDLAPGIRAGIVPGKTYEYLAAGRPILAAIPDGDARDILTSAGNAFVCRPSDVGSMTRILSERLDDFLAGKPPPTPDPVVVGRYEYGHLAREMSSFFDEVLGVPVATPAVPPG